MTAEAKAIVMLVVMAAANVALVFLVGRDAPTWMFYPVLLAASVTLVTVAMIAVVIILAEGEVFAETW